MKVTFERDVARILCKKHNIRAESCDCEHRAVLAGQQSSLFPKVTVIHLTNNGKKLKKFGCLVGCVDGWLVGDELG